MAHPACICQLLAFHPSLVLFGSGWWSHWHAAKGGGDPFDLPAEGGASARAATKLLDNSIESYTDESKSLYNYIVFATGGGCAVGSLPAWGDFQRDSFWFVSDSGLQNARRCWKILEVRSKSWNKWRAESWKVIEARPGAGQQRSGKYGSKPCMCCSNAAWPEVQEITNGLMWYGWYGVIKHGKMPQHRGSNRLDVDLSFYFTPVP